MRRPTRLASAVAPRRAGEIGRASIASEDFERICSRKAARIFSKSFAATGSKSRSMKTELHCPTGWRTSRPDPARAQPPWSARLPCAPSDSATCARPAGSTRCRGSSAPGCLRRPCTSAEWHTFNGRAPPVQAIFQDQVLPGSKTFNNHFQRPPTAKPGGRTPSRSHWLLSAPPRGYVVRIMKSPTSSSGTANSTRKPPLPPLPACRSTENSSTPCAMLSTADG